MALIGYLGPEGTYSEESVKYLYREETARFRPFGTIDAAIRAVATGEVTDSVVPIENSLGGAVNVTLDTLAHEVDLKITAELILPIKHNLLVQKQGGAIKQIISHPQALAQCRNKLALLYPEAILCAVDSSAEAARQVAAGRKDTAAIGSQAAAALYGLSIAAQDIQDSMNNCTRFIVLSKRNLEQVEQKVSKTSIVCQINGERPGSLCEILQEFASREVNLTRIESRPARTGLGNYIFFLDLAGSCQEEAVQAALRSVEKKSLWFKHLGSYPISSM